MDDVERLRERARELRAAGEIDDEIAELFISLADQAEHIEQLYAVIDQIGQLVIEFDERYGDRLPDPAAEEFETIRETVTTARDRFDTDSRSDSERP